MLDDLCLGGQDATLTSHVTDRWGVHLGVAAANTGAQRFYARLGFVELQRSDDEIYLGLSWR